MSTYDRDDAARIRAARAMRDLIDVVVRAALDDSDDRTAYRRAVELSTVVCSTLEAAAERGSSTPGGWSPYSRISPVCGVLNPIAPPFEFSVTPRAGDRPPTLVGTASFGEAYEGPPGSVHGGMIAAVLDEAVGNVAYAAGKDSVTGSLAIRFHKLAPLKTPLRVEAHWVRDEGRKSFCWAGLFLDREPLAEADAICIVPRSWE